MDRRTTRRRSDDAGERKHKRIDECVGWLMREVCHRGIEKVSWISGSAAGAYKLV